MEGASRKAATYSPTWCGSTIGANGLNFPVRYGKGWAPLPWPPKSWPPCPHGGKGRASISLTYGNGQEERPEAFRTWSRACGGRCPSIRAISTARLRTSLPLHLRPIDVVVSHGPLKKTHLAAGFALICLQRLSRPDIATRQCHWRDNRCTRGRSSSVLSY